MIWIIILVVSLLILKFVSDTKRESEKMESVGGIKTKYAELIKKFDYFDVLNRPLILEDKTNWYQLGWAGYSTLISIALFEYNDILNIEFRMKYNIDNLKREGIETARLPTLDQKYSWKFDSDEDPDYIIQTITDYINSLI